jgi:hypothetical protein
MGVLWGLFRDGSVQAIKDADEIAALLKSKQVRGVADEGTAFQRLVGALNKLDDQFPPNADLVAAGVAFDRASVLQNALKFKNIEGFVIDANGIAKNDSTLARFISSPRGPYFEVMTAGKLLDSGHQVISMERKFPTRFGDFDADVLSSFGGKTYGSQVKSGVPLNKTPSEIAQDFTTLAKRMSEWVNQSPTQNIGRFVFPKKDPGLIPQYVWQAIKTVNPNIKIVDLNGTEIIY